jgi:hypothetical protein
MDSPRDGLPVGAGHGGNERVDGLGVGALCDFGEHRVEQSLAYRPAHPGGAVDG